MSHLKSGIALTFLSFFFLTSTAQEPVVGPLMTSKWKTFEWPLNAALPECSAGTYGAVNGHIGNSCGPTAIAKLLHYHRHPEHGVGSHRYTDPDGYPFFADFENTLYKWNLMKDEFRSNATPEEYMPAAELVMHAHVMMEDPYQTGRSLADINQLMKKYMRYSNDAYVAYRYNYTREAYIALLKSELDAGRPLLIESWSSYSNPPGSGGDHAGHYWNIDGYDGLDRFHILWNNGDFGGWYDIDGLVLPELDIDAYYIWALIKARPDNSAKSFDFTFPGNHEMFKSGEAVTLTWNQKNVSRIYIDLNYDGSEWITIGENIPTVPDSWQWQGPVQYSRNMSFRIRDAVNPYYDFYFQGFQVYDQKSLSLESPVSEDTFEKGTAICIAWKSDGIRWLELEYRDQGSENWLLARDSIDGWYQYAQWNLPVGTGKSYDIRLSSMDKSYSAVAERITVAGKPQTGGPYAPDIHTLLLMHFDGELRSECGKTKAVGSGLAPIWEYSAPGKGGAVSLDNSARSNNSFLTIPNQESLQLTGSFTIDLWFKIDSWNMAYNNKPAILAKPLSGARFNYSLLGSGSKGSVAFKSRTTEGDIVVECTPGIIVPGIWYHAAMIHDETTRECKLLIHNARKERIDEQSQTYSEGHGMVGGIGDLTIGKAVTGATAFDGYVDELRISRCIREFDAVWSGVSQPEIYDHSVRVYPNPAAEYLIIDPASTDRGNLSVSILTSQGALVTGWEGPTIVEAGSRIRISTSGLTPGIYWLVLRTESQRIVRKVLIVR